MQFVLHAIISEETLPLRCRHGKGCEARRGTCQGSILPPGHSGLVPPSTGRTAKAASHSMCEGHSALSKRFVDDMNWRSIFGVFRETPRLWTSRSLERQMQFRQRRDQNSIEVETTYEIRQSQNHETAILQRWKDLVGQRQSGR